MSDISPVGSNQSFHAGVMDSTFVGRLVLLPECSEAVLVSGVRHFVSAHVKRVVCVEVTVSTDLIQYYYLDPTDKVEIVDDIASNMRGLRHG